MRVRSKKNLNATYEIFENKFISSSSSGRSSSTLTNSSNSRRNSLRQFFRHRDAVDEEEDTPMTSRGYLYTPY